MKYLDCKGASGRTLWDLSTVPLYWSCRPQGVKQDYVPKAFAEAEYLINLANLKGHTRCRRHALCKEPLRVAGPPAA